MSGDAAYVRHIRQCKASSLFRLDEPSGDAINIGCTPPANGSYNGTVTRNHRAHPLGSKVARFHEGYVALADDDVYSIPTAGLTVIAWVHLEGSGDADQFVISKRNTSGQYEYGLSYQNATSNPAIQANIFTSAAANRAVVGGAGPTLDPRSQWTMVWMIAIDGSYLTTGVNDGVKAAQTTSFSGSYTPSTAPVKIGALDTTSAGAITGNIGYVSFHPYALSLRDIAAAYRLGIGGAGSRPARVA